MQYVVVLSSGNGFKGFLIFLSFLKDYRHSEECAFFIVTKVQTVRLKLEIDVQKFSVLSPSGEWEQ